MDPNLVENTFRTRDESSRVLSTIAQSAMAAEQRIASLTSRFAGMALGGAAAAGMYTTLDGLVSINKKMEETQQQLAGNIQVYKFADNYADALLRADGALKQIREDAAKLPGSDSDFIQAFALTFPAQAELGQRNLKEMVKRSNELTAIALSKGIDAGQAGRDISLMMRGHAGEDVRTFRELKGVMGIKGTDEWNRLDKKKRLEKLDMARGKFSDTIKAFEGTWEAITSTSASYAKSTALAISQPLFEAVKGPLREMNDWLGRNNEQIEKFGYIAGTMVVEGLKEAAHWIATIMPGGNGLRGVVDFAQDFAQDHRSEITETFDNLVEAVGVFVPVVEHAAEFLWDFGYQALELASGMLPDLSYAVMVTAEGLAWFGEGIVSVAGWLVDTLGPAVHWIAEAFGGNLRFAVDVLSVALGGFWDELVDEWRRAGEWIDSVIGHSRGLTEWFGKVRNALVEMWNQLMEFLHQGKAAFYQTYMPDQGNGSGGTADALGDRIGKLVEARDKAEADKRKRLEKIEMEQAKKKGISVNQDFRGSKFSIEQAFAEGFDPGRVLTAVRDDVGKLAARRLSSGLTPLFTSI